MWGEGKRGTASERKSKGIERGNGADARKKRKKKKPKINIKKDRSLPLVMGRRAKKRGPCGFL